MAIVSSMIRKASSSLPINHLPKILSIINNSSIGGGGATQHHHFCTDGKKKLIDQKLVQALDALHKRAVPGPLIPPANFPFTIEDNPCDDFINLTRELDGEVIRVVVCMPRDDFALYPAYVLTKDPDFCKVNKKIDPRDGDWTACFDSCACPVSPTLFSSEKKINDKENFLLRVKISRQNGNNELGFTLRAYSKDDPMWVMDVSVYGGAQPQDDPLSYGLSPNAGGPDLENAFRDFLEIRGFDKAFVSFLHHYMKQRPIPPLEKMKSFLHS